MFVANMALRDVLAFLRNRLGGQRLAIAEKPRRKVWWRALLGFQHDKAQPARDTAWLDGLRGVAAFLVMTYHFHLAWFNPFELEVPYGATEDAIDLWRLPFLRLWMCSGHAQVSIFFVLSGFVLSWSSLASIRAGRLEKIAKSLGSAVFRRWLRLYLPCFVIAGWYFLAFWFHIIDIGGLGGVKKREANFFLQLWDYIRANERFANPFNVNRDQWTALHEYEATMWTIPYEFAGSLLVFMVLVAICRIREYNRRTLITVGLALYAGADGRWAFWLFASGVVLADYIRQRGGFQAISQTQNIRMTIVWSLVFIFGLYIAGFPEPNPEWKAVGYQPFVALTPSSWAHIEGGGRFWWCWAGIIIISSASHLSGVRRVFDISFARYLGKISYMLYLTHRIVLRLLGEPLKAALLSAFGREKFINVPAGDSLGHMITTLVIYVMLMGVLAPIALFVAHWVSKFVDEPSVWFAKWVDDFFTKGSSQPPPDTNRAHTDEEGVRLLQAEMDELSTHHGPTASHYPV